MRFTWMLLAAGCALCAESPQAPALKGLDPVSLTRGEETRGLDALSVRHKGYQYLFATQESRSEFLRRPERYQIQFDGACGKMGPASGAGSPDRWALHDGRIYIFASDSCRRTFLTNPEGHLERDDSAPPFTADQAQRGRALLDRAVQAMGAVDQLRTLEERWETAAEKKKHAAAFVTRAWRFPDIVRRETEYLEWGADGAVIGPSGGAVLGPNAPPSRMRPAQEAAIERDLALELAPLLRARRGKDFQAWDAGGGKVGVLHRGTLVTLALDPSSGLVLSMTYRGRGPGGSFGSLQRTFGDYRETGGVRLPHRIDTSIDGTPWPAHSLRAMSIRVNHPIEQSRFPPPPGE